MQIIDHTTTPPTSYAPATKNRFRTALGFGSLSRESSDTNTQTTKSDIHNLTFTRQSIDTARSYASRKKNRADRDSVANISFFQQDIQAPKTPISDNHPSIVDLTIDTSMTVENSLSQPSSRRPPVRMDAQDGPWSVSVAETPHDVHSYSLYIKSKSITSNNFTFKDGHIVLIPSLILFILHPLIRSIWFI